MPRAEQIIRKYRRGDVTLDVTERYTLSQTLPDGTVIYSDGDGLWRINRPGRVGVSWKGEPPAGWDPAAAVEHHHACHYEMDVDYS